MTTLPDLITAAAAGGPNAPMPLSLAAALTTLVAEDHANPQTPPYTGLPVTIEVDNGGGIAEYTVQVGDLHYSLCAEDTDQPAYRLCREDGCLEIAAGKTPLTRVCRDHMNALQRLDAWETETRAALSHLEGDLRFIAQTIDRRT